MNLIWMKVDTKHKESLRNLEVFNSQISLMVSNASQAVASCSSEVMNYAFIVFLRCNIEVTLGNFKTIVHTYCLSQCNGFGIADDQMLRIGTGMYYPAVGITTL